LIAWQLGNIPGLGVLKASQKYNLIIKTLDLTSKFQVGHATHVTIWFLININLKYSCRGKVITLIFIVES